jgi:signal peptidase II
MLFFIAGAVIVLDQITKYFVRTQLAFTEQWAPWSWLLPYARIVHWNNTGAAFGIFQGMNFVFAILAVIVSIVIVIYYPRVPRQDWLMRLALSLQLGGAVGNLIDRILYGTVTDFISVGNFAVFNVADSSVVVGTTLLAIDLMLKERKERREAHQKDDNPADRSLGAGVPRDAGDVPEE